ncbi:hypothetical protein M0R45_010266 [Rubus argutus]|uniref:Uncharacterized protein n=1 Tax=Rubus argutus TaxID=59490 RepID=A0AAW1Y8B6_RUBAR
MAFFLLKLIFFGLSFMSNLVLRLIFSATAHLVVLLINGYRAPRQATHGLLQQLSEVIKSCFQYMLKLIMEAVSALISALYDYLKEGLTGSASVATSAIGGLIEKTKNSLDGLTDFPEVFEGLSEMVSQMVMDLWNNCKDALGYITENA